MEITNILSHVHQSGPLPLSGWKPCGMCYNLWWVQEDWKLLEYPHCKGTKPKDPTHYINDYKMDELADLLWLGGILARHGTDAYRDAWSHLQKALVHYLYGFDATQADMRTAANELFQYAEQVEKHVQAG
jgi:hypothetical protein